MSTEPSNRQPSDWTSEEFAAVFGGPKPRNPIDRLNWAEVIAPIPATRDAHVRDWIRHYAALGLGAYSAFQDLLADPELHSADTIGYLTLVGQTATAAAAALLDPRPWIQWDLTPEAGALNGEWEQWLTATLDDLGINPADLDDRYRPADFRSSSRAAAHQATLAEQETP